MYCARRDTDDLIKYNKKKPQKKPATEIEIKSKIYRCGQKVMSHINLPLSVHCTLNKYMFFGDIMKLKVFVG